MLGNGTVPTVSSLWISCFLSQFVAGSVLVQLVPPCSRRFQLFPGGSCLFKAVLVCSSFYCMRDAPRTENAVVSSFCSVVSEIRIFHHPFSNPIFIKYINLFFFFYHYGGLIFQKIYCTTCFIKYQNKNRSFKLQNS